MREFQPVLLTDPCRNLPSRWLASGDLLFGSRHCWYTSIPCCAKLSWVLPCPIDCPAALNYTDAIGPDWCASKRLPELSGVRHSAAYSGHFLSILPCSEVSKMISSQGHHSSFTVPVHSLLESLVEALEALLASDPEVRILVEVQRQEHPVEEEILGAHC
jgi:hypothetical protein